MSPLTASIGQTHPNQRLPPSSTTSIISLLTSGTIRERTLGIHIHHHFGYRLHLTWSCSVRRTQRHRWGIERRFPSFSGIDDFCSGLITLQDTSSCICERWTLPFLYHKSHICFTLSNYSSNDDILHIPGSLLTSLQECQSVIHHQYDYRIPNQCYCLIQPATLLASRYSVFEDSDSEGFD
jgi:hypothetical protein